MSKFLNIFSVYNLAIRRKPKCIGSSALTLVVGDKTTCKLI